MLNSQTEREAIVYLGKHFKDNPADYMSQHHLPETCSCSHEQKINEYYVNFITKTSKSKDISEVDICQHLRHDAPSCHQHDTT